MDLRSFKNSFCDYFNNISYYTKINYLLKTRKFYLNFILLLVFFNDFFIFKNIQ